MAYDWLTGKPSTEHRVSPHIAVTIAFSLLLSSVSSLAASAAKAPTLAPFAPQLALQMVDAADGYGTRAVDTCFSSWFHEYVTSRIVPIEYTVREPIAFGPWYAEKDYSTKDARDDGSITEWADNYYITHDWSNYGQQILSFIPGDTVTINDRTVRVDGLFNYPKASFYEEVVAITGSECVVFQTCYPDSEYNRVVFCTLL